jgi:hypothetical protein
MNKLFSNGLTVFFILFISLTCYSQLALKGNYSNQQGQFLKFKDHNEIHFCLIQNSDLGPIKMIGQGIYIIKKNQIIVNTTLCESNGENLRSTYTFISKNDKSNLFEFQIKDRYDNPICCGYIIYKNKIYRANYKGIINCVISEFPKDSLLFIKGIDSKLVKLKMKTVNGGKFKVILLDNEYRYIEKKKIYLTFNIHSDTIECSYMSNNAINKLILDKPL